MHLIISLSIYDPIRTDLWPFLGHDPPVKNHRFQSNSSRVTTQYSQLTHWLGFYGKFSSRHVDFPEGPWCLPGPFQSLWSPASSFERSPLIRPKESRAPPRSSNMLLNTKEGITTQAVDHGKTLPTFMNNIGSLCLPFHWLSYWDSIP